MNNIKKRVEYLTIICVVQGYISLTPSFSTRFSDYVMIRYFSFLLKIFVTVVSESYQKGLSVVIFRSLYFLFIFSIPMIRIFN